MILSIWVKYTFSVCQVSMFYTIKSPSAMIFKITDNILVQQVGSIRAICILIQEITVDLLLAGVSAICE